MTGQRLPDLVEALREGTTGTGVDIDGVVYRLPPLTPLDWAAALLDNAPDAILPGLLAPADAQGLYARLLDVYDDLTLTVMEEAGLWLLEQAAARPWWEARRALLAAVSNWSSFDAWCTHECAGLDPTTLTLARFCNLVVRWVLLHTPEEDQDAWELSFTSPPPSADLGSRPEWADDAVAADTEAVMDQWAGLVAAAGAASPD